MPAFYCRIVCVLAVERRSAAADPRDAVGSSVHRACFALLSQPLVLTRVSRVQEKKRPRLYANCMHGSLHA